MGSQFVITKAVYFYYALGNCITFVYLYLLNYLIYKGNSSEIEPNLPCDTLANVNNVRRQKTFWIEQPTIKLSASCLFSFLEGKLFELEERKIEVFKTDRYR